MLYPPEIFLKLRVHVKCMWSKVISVHYVIAQSSNIIYYEGHNLKTSQSHSIVQTNIFLLPSSLVISSLEA